MEAKHTYGLDRQACRARILTVVREMAIAYPEADYCFARERFGLLGKVRCICNMALPTASQCWEAVGLDRSHLVDEFTFTQEDQRIKAAGSTSPSLPHVE